MQILYWYHTEMNNELVNSAGENTCQGWAKEEGISVEVISWYDWIEDKV